MGLSCKICFESASSGQGMHARITPCGHVFCQGCATTWFRTDKACPVCRHTVDGLSSLISLYDQDAGFQSCLPSDDDNNEVGGGRRRRRALLRETETVLRPNGDIIGEQRERERERQRRKNPEVEEEEEVHVGYVLGKVSERWQQVMMERARLKVQVARLEKSRQELAAQLQRVNEENAGLRQLLSSSPHLSCPQELDTEEEVWNPRLCSDSNATDTGFAKPQVLESLRVDKWELAHSFAMHSGPVHGIAVNPSGNLVATASWDHQCKVYDIHLEEEVAVLTGHELGLYAVKFSPSKRDVVGTVSSDHTCRLWSADTADCLHVLEGHTDEVNGLAFKTGTHLLATVSDDTTTKIWDAEKGLCVTTFRGHRQAVYGVCFQPQGHLLATASFDLTAKLWDPRTGHNVCNLTGHLEDVIGIDIDSSGNLLATGSDDKTCRVWDLRMGSTLEVLEEHLGEVKRVAFSPFSRVLATTSGDTTVRLFSTSTFKCLHVLSSHSDHVFDVAWSPTADFIVTASHDHFWKLWQPRVLPCSAKQFV